MAPLTTHCFRRLAAYRLAYFGGSHYEWICDCPRVQSITTNGTDTDSLPPLPRPIRGGDDMSRRTQAWLRFAKGLGAAAMLISIFQPPDIKSWLLLPAAIVVMVCSIAELAFKDEPP